MKNLIFLFVFALVFQSCVSKKENISNEDLNVLLSNGISKYYETKNDKYLFSVYQKLSKNKDFVEQGLVGKNSFPIISLFLSLKKYDELEKLLVNNNTINKYNRLNTLNTVRYFKFNKIDKKKANFYIIESINMIKDTLNRNPKDSLLYADYFSMRMFLVGKENVLKEIDSMQSVNKKYSDMFYNAILKNNIKNYPE